MEEGRREGRRRTERSNRREEYQEEGGGEEGKYFAKSIQKRQIQSLSLTITRIHKYVNL